MINRVCIYISVFLLTLYCFFLYRDSILGMLLITELVYPVLALAVLVFAKRGITAQLGTILEIAEKEQKIPVRVRVRNGSRIPAVHVRVKLRIENSFTGEEKICRMQGCALSREMLELQAQICSTDCGHLRIVLENVEIYDPLHIFLMKKKYGEGKKVGVLPKCHLLPVEVSRRTREFLADAEEYSDREKGDDPGEIYQIREYKDKDSLHDIHWKLSAKSDELLVKEYGKPLGPVVLIWLNLDQSFVKSGRRIGRKKQGWPAGILEAVASLSFSLLEEKCVHMAAWYEEKNQCAAKMRVSRELHVYELINRLLYALPYKGGAQMPERDHFSTVVEFRLDGAVLVNGEEHMRIPVNGEQIDWDGIYFTV